MSESPFNRIDAQNHATLNPWRSMWLHPRLTVRHLINTNPRYAVLLLAIASGICNVISESIDSDLASRFNLATILGLLLLTGAVAGIIGLYVGGWLIGWTGSWIKGQASNEHIRTALAWSNVPTLWLLLVWLIMIAATGLEFFANQTPNLDASPLLALVMLAGWIATVVLGIWSLVLLVAGIAEAQGFSIPKAIGNLLLAFLMVLVFWAIIGVIAAIVIPLVLN